MPALLEYLPYRKSDWTAVRDAQRQPYTPATATPPCESTCAARASRGHPATSTRAGTRGASTSIAWLAQQPWCTGRVGMLGISWGGFNSCRSPRCASALKAIVTVCSTDDRYDNDVHYTGGCVLAPTCSPGPPRCSPRTPARPTRGRRRRWREHGSSASKHPAVPPDLAGASAARRLLEARLARGLRRHRRAVFAVGGCATATRTRCRASSPGSRSRARASSAPGRTRSRTTPPRPRIGFLQETLRWWDHWLKGIDTGVMDEPMLRCGFRTR